MIGWDEVMEGGELDRKDVIIHAWQRVDKIKEATSKGYRVIAQPAAYCYLDMKQTIHERGLMWAAIIDLEKVYSLDPIKTPGLTPEEARLVMGVQGGLWARCWTNPHVLPNTKPTPGFAPGRSSLESTGEQGLGRF